MGKSTCICHFISLLDQIFSTQKICFISILILISQSNRIGELCKKLPLYCSLFWQLRFPHPKPCPNFWVWIDKEFMDEDGYQNTCEESNRNGQVVLSDIGIEFVVDHFLNGDVKNKNSKTIIENIEISLELFIFYILITNSLLVNLLLKKTYIF